MARPGIAITELDPIGSNIALDSVLPIVDPNYPPGIGETFKINVQNLGNYILANVAPNTNANLGPIENVTILGGNAGDVLSTDGDGHLYWSNDINFPPGGIEGSVQFKDGNNFQGTNNFTFDFANNVLFANGTANITGNTSVGGILTDNYYYANGSPVDFEQPAGSNTQVQYNDDDDFGASANFTWDSNLNILTVDNITLKNNSKLNFDNNGNTVGFATPSELNSNISFVLPNTTGSELQVLGIVDQDTQTLGWKTAVTLPDQPGTSQQVLGIVNQETQQLSWKTVPVYYVNIGLRDGGSYLSSPNPVLRVYPIRQRDGSFLNVNTLV